MRRIGRRSTSSSAKLSSKQAQSVFDACEYFISKEKPAGNEDNLEPWIFEDGTKAEPDEPGGTGYYGTDQWRLTRSAYRDSDVLKCMMGELELLTVAVYHLMDGDQVIRDIHTSLKKREIADEKPADPLVDRCDGAWTKKNGLLTEATQEDVGCKSMGLINKRR